MRANLLRLLTALLGASLLLLALLNPLVSPQYQENGEPDRDKTPPLTEGTVLTQPLSSPSALQEVSVLVGSVQKKRGLTLTLSLLRDGTVEAQERFDLRRAKAGKRLILSLPSALPPGDYVLRITAEGDGMAKLKGQRDVPCTVDGADSPVGCLLRTATEKREYGLSALYCGALLLALAFTPGGGGKAVRLPRVQVAARKGRWVLGLSLAVVTCAAFVLAGHPELFGLSGTAALAEDELPVVVLCFSRPLHLPLLCFLLGGSWCAVWVVWELAAPQPALHRLAFALALLCSLTAALCKPAMLPLGWDEGAHRELIRAAAGPSAYPLPEQLRFFSTWYLGYVPNLLGMALGSLLHLSDGWLYRLGSLAGCVAYALLVAQAVRHAPRAKLTFLAAGTLPTCLFIASGFTYDAVVIAGVALGAALVLEALAAPETLLSGSDALAMLLTLSLCTLCKPAYSLVLLLPLLLPRTKFSSRSRHAAFVAFTLALLAACLAACLLGAYDGMMGGDERMDGTDSRAQLLFALADPGRILATLIRFIAEQLPRLLASAAVAWGPSGSDGALSVLLLVLLVVVSPFGDASSAPALTGKRRVLLAVAGLLPLLALTVTQYFVSTAVGAGTVDGMQPRYFLPVLVLLALSLAPPRRWLSEKLSRPAVAILCAALPLCFFISGWQWLILPFYGA